MVQDCVRGREVSCGVLEAKTGRLQVMPPTELIPNDSEFFDYKAKYSQGGAEEITPPNKMTASTIKAIQDCALKAHEILGCRSYSRTDMFVNDEGVHLIETNTLPGMTATSILPRQAEAAGISLEQLIDHLIQRALAV
jgi:D-alanine-D-alanine ligase